MRSAVTTGDATTGDATADAVAPHELRALFTVPPAEFVAARTALARSLKTSGRKAAGAAVARIGRPRVPEHALNLVAAHRPEVASRWADAVMGVEQAQSSAIGGGSGEALRSVTAEWREATGALVDAAVSELGEAGEKHRADIIATLRPLGTTPGAVLVREGLVGSAEAGEQALFAGAPEPVERAPRAARPTPRASGAAARRAEPTDRGAAAEPARRERAPRPAEPRAPDPALLRRAETEARRTAASLGVAEREVERARAALAEAEARRVEAQAAADEAAAALARLGR